MKRLKNLVLKDSWKFVLLLLLISIPIFQYLGSQAIRLFDEARLANNAYEMYHSGLSIVTTYGGKPDMCNTKPPLLIWLQVLSMKVAGINETGLRLPSAFAAFFTCILLLLLGWRYMKEFWVGFIWVFVLITSMGYFDVDHLHCIRSCDYDALLTFFLTWAAITFFLFFETTKKKHIYFFFVSMALAVLTKSAAALMVLPGFFIYTVIKKKVLLLLKSKDFYIGMFLFLLLTGSYYFLREIYNPGYLTAVWKNEFGGRFLGILDGHSHSFWFYFENFTSTDESITISNRFVRWMPLLPCGILAGLLSKDVRIKNLTLFSTTVAITYFLVISTAQTKLHQYDLPLYPFFAILVGVFIHFIFSFLKDQKKILHYLKYNIVPYIFLFLLFITPYSEIVKKTYKPKEHPKFEEGYRINYYVRDIIRGDRQWDNISVLHDGYAADLRFYVNILNEKGKNITLKEADKELETGEIVLCSQHGVKWYVEQNYEYNTLDEFHNIRVYEIMNKKE